MCIIHIVCCPHVFCASLHHIFVFMLLLLLLLWSVLFTTSLVLRCFFCACSLSQTHTHACARTYACTFLDIDCKKDIIESRKNQLTPHNFLVLKSIWCSSFPLSSSLAFLCYSDKLIHHIRVLCVTWHLNETRRENQIEKATKREKRQWWFNWNGHSLRWY